MAKLFELRSQLQNLKKDSLPATAYINKFKGLCNHLAAIGESISYNDRILYLLGGLGSKYNQFLTYVINRLDKPSIKDIHSFLLSYEFHLDAQNSSNQLSSLEANFFQLNPTTKFYKSPYPSSFQHRSSAPQFSPILNLVF